MEQLKIAKGQLIAKKKDAVKEWYLVQEGTVVQKLDFAELELKKDSLIGTLESDRFLCDYIAKTDVTVSVFKVGNVDDLKSLLAGQPKLKPIMLKALIEQRYQLFGIYLDLHTKSRQFHSFLETFYNDYKTHCAKLELEEQPYTRMDYFNPLKMNHKVENWEFENSDCLVKNYFSEYMDLMMKDDSLSVGVVMEAFAQIHRCLLGIGEMTAYLLYNREIMFAESENDLYHLYFDLAMRAGSYHYDISQIKKEAAMIAEFAKKLNMYDAKMLNFRISEFNNTDFENTGLDDFATVGFEEEVELDGLPVDAGKEDCLERILAYAGIAENEREAIREKIDEYRTLPDILSTDDNAYRLRKQLTAMFYDVYEKVFMRSLSDGDELHPIIMMFLNFGFMDVKMVGEEYTNVLFDLVGHLDVCQSNHVYTIYSWLMAIYKGDKEPCRNEFDMDYPAYLAEQKKSGEITKEQVQALMNDKVAKVKFELKNMFTSGNRITYGKLTTFCPILGEYDLLNSVEKMLVTTERLDEALNNIRKVDFSVFYREGSFSDPKRDINREVIMKEVLPDIILMPNAGTKAMMWQETAGVKRDTPGRFLFPIFTAVDLDEMMMETIGRFRWEMCRKEQGVRWNDIREKSLTSEYCDYIQFYRKNHDLSTDAKEKIKIALTRARNNYREVFVKDYLNWIKYESKGSFRLNKVARDILVRYCPFPKEIRTDLKANPMYQNSISRYEVEVGRKLQRVAGVYEKYKKAGGVITPELRDNLMFYQM